MKIKNIKKIQVEEQWVYDITVRNERGAQNFYIDGGVVLKNCGPSCHSGTQSTGSRTCFYNGRPLARVGDNINCGSRNATGSPDHFVNT